jgi:hypothetical protein
VASHQPADGLPHDSTGLNGARLPRRRSSTSRRRSQQRLTASHCDGARATIDTTNTTSKAARTRGRGKSAYRSRRRAEYVPKFG